MLDEPSWDPCASRDLMARSHGSTARQSWAVVCIPGSAQPHQQGDGNPNLNSPANPKPNSHPNSHTNPNPDPNPTPWALQAGWPHPLTGVQKQEHKWVRAELSTHLGTHGCRNSPQLQE